MRQVQSILLAAMLLVAIPACDEALRPDVVRVAGTVRHYDFEGGFWAVRSDDGTTYDPAGGLPLDFRQEGIRVFLHARVRPDFVTFHWVGPVVELISLRRL